MRVGFPSDESARAQVELFHLNLAGWNPINLTAPAFRTELRGDPSRFAAMPWTPEQRAALETQRRHYQGTVEAFYRYADEWLGRTLKLRGPDTGVILLSDHGFEPEPDPERTGYHVSAPPGIFVVAGPGVRPGFRAEGATLYDVLPTLAASLGHRYWMLTGTPVDPDSRPGYRDLQVSLDELALAIETADRRAAKSNS